MSDDEKKFRVLLGKAVGSLVAQHAKIQRELEDLQALIDSEPTAGAQAKQIVAAHKRAWESRYRGETYVPVYAKDVPQAKRLLKSLHVEDVYARLSRFMASNDRFIADTARHSFGVFVSTINQHGSPASPLQIRPSNCRHDPPCASDQAHTSRYLSEMRDMRV